MMHAPWTPVVIQAVIRLAVAVAGGRAFRA